MFDTYQDLTTLAIVCLAAVYLIARAAKWCARQSAALPQAGCGGCHKCPASSASTVALKPLVTLDLPAPTETA